MGITALGLKVFNGGRAGDPLDVETGEGTDTTASCVEIIEGATPVIFASPEGGGDGWGRRIYGTAAGTDRSGEGSGLRLAGDRDHASQPRFSPTRRQVTQCGSMSERELRRAASCSMNSDWVTLPGERRSF